jgi:hypothetical protein
MDGNLEKTPTNKDTWAQSRPVVFFMVALASITALVLWLLPK